MVSKQPVPEMSSLARYVVLSFAVAGGLVYHALKTREQYFPAMLYLSTSKLSVVVLGNLAFAMTLCLGHVLKAVFLGQLREAEIERLYERSKDAIMETCLAMTIFREEFNVKFVVLFVSLLFVKIFHWLAGDRVEFMEQSPSTTRLAHLRVCSLVVVLVALDSSFLGYAVAHTLNKGPSVLLLFGFEYVILASRAVAVAAKYVITQVDTRMDGRWDGKGTCVFYLELITDLLHLFVYFVFFLIIFAYYGLPVHLVRDLYVTFRNFRRRVRDFLRYRKVTANLNERFPDCTDEELEQGDDVCIICREDMRCDAHGGSRAKKLPCGHAFHLGCLRSWLERQQQCPTCRAPVLPEEEADVNARREAAAAAIDGGDAARDAAMRAAFQRELFGEQPGGAAAGVEAQPATTPAPGQAAPPGDTERRSSAGQATSGDAYQRRDEAPGVSQAAAAATRRAAAGQAAGRARDWAAPAPEPRTPPSTPPPPPPWPSVGPPNDSPAGATPAWMRPAGAETQHIAQPHSPWSSLAATAASGDASSGNAGGHFSPAQAHQIASATASAVAAAAAQAQMAMFGLAPPGALDRFGGFGPVGGLGGATPGELLGRREFSFSNSFPSSAEPPLPPSPAQTAVARLEVSLLEAKMDLLREQLEAATARAEGMGANSVAGPFGAPHPSTTETNEKKPPTETGEAPETETANGKAPVEARFVEHVDAGPDVASGSGSGSQSIGGATSETTSETEAEAVRRRRVERFEEAARARE